MGRSLRWFWQSRSCLSSVILLTMSLLFLLLWIHFPGASPGDIELSTAQLFDPDEQLVEEADRKNLVVQIKDLYRIKQSVLRQLRDLEKKSAVLSTELLENERYVKDLKAEIIILNESCSILQRAAHYMELEAGKSPKIGKPLRILFDPKVETREIHGLQEHSPCDMESCFDYSRCPITSGFPVFLAESSCKLSPFLEALHQSPYLSPNSVQSCVTVHLICESEELDQIAHADDWRNGTNTVVFLLNSLDIPASVRSSKALIVSQIPDQLRNGFDLFMPGFETGDWDALPPQVPAIRKVFLYHAGQWSGTNPRPDDDAVIGALRQSAKNTADPSLFDLSFTCDKPISPSDCVGDSWCLCAEDQLVDLGRATFSLALWSHNRDHSAMRRVLQGLKFGAIPVLLGFPQMPLDEMIDWNKAVIRLPKARAPELHWILHSIRHEDILAYRYNGRRIWETYFSSAQAVTKAVLDVIRTRLNIPAAPENEVNIRQAFTGDKQPNWFVVTPVAKKEDTEIFGPIEFPLASDTFQRNFSSTTLDRYDEWNVRFMADALPMHSPFAPFLPGDAKFRGSEYGFRPLGGGAGGTGNEFREALSGNLPREQFTIVILTYQRESVLSFTLSTLHNLPYLHKVIVVWNGELDLPESISLPKLHVPILVHKAANNSLNNRFLPFDAIETECVLHLDDDVRLRHDEMVLGFRVWRENRERIVGFPARYHAWDPLHQTWLYNSNYTCEYSMILTGAAFLHKYYMVLYSSRMHPVIRDKVDEFQNCEDIAMNFLVSHQTRKPPLKVTSRWTFPCPDCPQSLWEDKSHFEERHQCIQFFERVYGYMPLLNSQYRADSVLFKTRIPADKQKCFRYV